MKRRSRKLSIIFEVLYGTYSTYTQSLGGFTSHMSTYHSALQVSYSLFFIHTYIHTYIQYMHEQIWKNGRGIICQYMLVQLQAREKNLSLSILLFFFTYIQGYSIISVQQCSQFQGKFVKRQSHNVEVAALMYFIHIRTYIHTYS